MDRFALGVTIELEITMVSGTSSGTRLRVRRRGVPTSEVEVTDSVHNGALATWRYTPPASGIYDWRVWRADTVDFAQEGSFSVDESLLKPDSQFP